MKTSKIITIISCVLLVLNLGFATGQVPKGKKQTLTVLNIDAQGLTLSPVQIGNILRVEVDKLDTFEVTDRYDVAYLLEKNKLNTSNCFGKICLVETGKAIETDKIIGGSVELISSTIVVTLKLIDVKSESVEKTYIKEFINLPNELQSILRVSVREMFSLSNPPELIAQLTKPFSYESVLNEAPKNKLNLSGPRMGIVALTGGGSKLFTTSKEKGGYGGAYPAMFQFGYQFEMQYLSAGSFSALFEVIPMLTGFDQNQIIPSLTIMNGLRNVHNGWEIAFGPTFNLVKMANVYKVDNVQYLADSETFDNSIPTEFREDGRGEVRLRSQFVIALGKSFKSGKMNIPVNIYMVPGLDGFRFGISFGYNARKD